MRLLIDLIRAVPAALDYPPAALTAAITSITCDSRKVRRGSLFVALKGLHADGARFIADAKLAGAAAILCEPDVEVDPEMVFIRSDNPRRALAFIAAAFYGSSPEHIVAVTGTDGKTSTADFFRQLMQLMGKKSASIGTLGVLLGDGELLHGGSHTTPDAIELQKILHETEAMGVQYIAMEASSHGLDQYRLDAVKLQAAAFTNIARDHLDYHLSEAAYFAAKSRLFSELLAPGATAVLNQDDRRFPELEAICIASQLHVIGFGRHGARYRIERIEPLAHGQTVHLNLDGKSCTVDILLVGAFQVMNILAALGLAVGCGVDVNQALHYLSHLKGVPGRLEKAVQLKNGAAVYIDYAHTPMALANILSTLRPHTKGNLAVVFGCGGDRDAGKRPEMGRIANDLADVVIVTDDNPRSENPADIRMAILAACPKAREIADRREAIYAGIKQLHAGDILVIAGKGHEEVQIIGARSHAFNDKDVARQAARELQLAA